MILRELYLGNIFPAEQAIEDSKEFREANQKVLATLDKMEKEFSKDQMKMIDELHTYINESHCCETENVFQMGFALGMKMAQEANTIAKNLEK